MKIYLVSLLTVLTLTAFGQHTGQAIKNDAFVAGEVLSFRLHYGIITAGSATLEVKPAHDKITGKSCYRVTALASSSRSFDWFFRVRDSYESLIDESTLLPYQFDRKIEEGKYRKVEQIRFDREKNTAYDGKEIFPVPPGVQDIISFFYYVRTIDFTHAMVGTIFPIMGFLDDRVVPLNVKFLGREVIKSELGKINCLILEPQLQEGQVLKDKENMRVWLSDDQNKVPVRVQASILVGSLNMDLTGVKNLNSPLLVAK